MKRRSFVGAVASLLAVGCREKSAPPTNKVFINKPASKEGKWVEVIDIVLTDKHSVANHSLNDCKIVFELHRSKKGAIVIFNDACEFLYFWPGKHRVISDSNFWETDLPHMFFKITYDKLSGIWAPY